MELDHEDPTRLQKEEWIRLITNQSSVWAINMLFQHICFQDIKCYWIVIQVQLVVGVIVKNNLGNTILFENMSYVKIGLEVLWYIIIENVVINNFKGN